MQKRDKIEVQAPKTNTKDSDSDTNANELESLFFDDNEEYQHALMDSGSLEIRDAPKWKWDLLGFGNKTEYAGWLSFNRMSNEKYNYEHLIPDGYQLCNDDY